MKPAVTLTINGITINYFLTAGDADVYQSSGKLATDLAGTDFCCPQVKCGTCPAYIADIDCKLTLHKLLLQHRPDLLQTHPEYFL